MQTQRQERVRILCSAKASVGGRYEVKEEEEEDGVLGLSGDQSLGIL